MNGLGPGVKYKYVTAAWKKWLIALNIIVAAGLLAWGICVAVIAAKKGGTNRDDVEE